MNWSDLLPRGAAGIAVCAALLAVCLALILYFAHRQRRNRLLRIAMDDSSMAGDLKLALGPDGIRQMLPYFKRQIGNGTSVAKLLILELIGGIDFEGKTGLVKSAFDSGPLEVQFAIVDQIFSWNLPFELLPYVVEHCGAPLAEYLARMLFLHYSDIEDHGELPAVQKQGALFSRNTLPEEASRMSRYVFDGKRDEYNGILNALLTSNRKQDRLFAAEVMAAFIGREDAVNRKYVAEVIGNTAQNPTELEEMVELCAQYDDGMAFLKRDLSNYYGYDFLKKICVFYEPTGIVKSFAGSGYPIPTALVLSAACRLDSGSVGAYHACAEQLLAYLLRLNGERGKIHAAGFRAGRLLLDETERLKRTLTAVLLEYLLLSEAGVRCENRALELDKALSGGNFSSLLSGLRGDTGVAMLSIMDDTVQPGGSLDYSVLRVSENNALLESIYRYSGGEPMDTRLTDNIEKLITLKSIPMFSELDVFTLQQIQKISVYKKIPAGETVIAEGEEGASMYIVIGGKVGVYKGEKHINDIGAGGLFGEMAIIEKQRRSATIKTLEETSFLTIDGDDFLRLMERNSSVSGSVIKTLAGRLRKMLEANQ